MNKNNMLLLCLLAFSVVSPLIAADTEKVHRQEELAPWENPNKAGCASDCDSIVLRIRDICAKNISTQCLRSCNINNTQGIIADSVCANNVTATSISTDNLCVNNNVSFGALTNLAVKGDLCVNGMINQSEICQVYRATVDYVTSFSVYTLGAPLTFNNIVDDPNNNVTLSPAMAYTVPVTGYYIVNVQVNQNNLVTATQILGIPTSYIDLLVNSVVVRTSAYPYLSFTNMGNSVLAALVLLNAGDQVQADYRISFVSQTTGLTNVVGTVTMVGGPANSLFSIHYLSSSTCTASPCSAIEINCNTICAPMCS